jgi:hypothetical protein
MVVKFTLKIFKVAFIVFIVLNLFGLFLDYHMRNSNIFKINVLFNKKLPENIILGSSRSLTGINTDMLSKLTNKKWFNLSMDDTRIETHYLFYELLVELGKSPKKLLLQFDNSGMEIDSTTFFDNDYQILPFINSNKIVSNYFSHKKNYYLFKYLPIYKYVYFNVELFYPSFLLFFKPNYSHRFKQNGDYDYPKNMVMKKDDMQFSERFVNLDNRSLQKLFDLAKSHKTELIVYTAPIFKASTSIKNTKNLSYFDFTTTYSSHNCFSDDFHIAHNTKNDFTILLYRKFLK